jgi:hypothetical protein
LDLAWLIALASQAGDLWPAQDQAVVGQGLGSPLLPLAEAVEAVAEFAGDLGLVPELLDQRGRMLLATRFEDADQLMDSLPMGEPLVRGRAQSVRSSSGFKIRTLPRLEATIPASTNPARLVVRHF